VHNGTNVLPLLSCTIREDGWLDIWAPNPRNCVPWFAQVKTSEDRRNQRLWISGEARLGAQHRPVGRAPLVDHLPACRTGVAGLPRRRATTAAGSGAVVAHRNKMQAERLVMSAPRQFSYRPRSDGVQTHCQDNLQLRKRKRPDYNDFLDLAVLMLRPRAAAGSASGYR
jgi:hypothetical protein